MMYMLQGWWLLPICLIMTEYVDVLTLLIKIEMKGLYSWKFLLSYDDDDDYTRARPYDLK